MRGPAFLPPRLQYLSAPALAVALLALASPLTAIETRSVSGPVEVRIELSPDAPLIGDPMTLQIEALAGPGIEVLMPAFGEALDRFRIVDFVPRQQLNEDGRTLHSQRYTLQVPSSGEHSIPPILLEFIDHRPGQAPAPDDLDAYEILSESIPFAVESVVPDSASADLSPPMDRLDPLGAGGERWPWLLGAGLLLVVGCALGAVAWRNWAGTAAIRSAGEVATSELDALLAGALPTDKNVSAFYVKLSGIVRRYLENRFSLRSPELTTERFLEEVSGSPDLGGDHQALLRDFLVQADLVKFAHHLPSPVAVRETVEKARRFIDETREIDAPGGAPSKREAA
ncbi:MAG: hypothetical protein NZ990_06950 [Myxococcota bacterium]|nr:hypothetical protein [Myxococcota bacterium]